MSHQNSLGSRSRGPLLYAGILVLAACLFLVIRWIGEHNAASRLLTTTATTPAEVSPQTQPAVPASSVSVVQHVLATLAVLVALGNLLGRLFKWLGQPPVIGEVVAGICLGPSVLGLMSPQLMHALIPDVAADPNQVVAASLKIIAELGVILYMFVVGLDLNAARLKEQAHSAVAISHAGIVAPFLLGSILALGLHPGYAPAGTPFTSFALFTGVAMAITAFPVLARILTDRNLETTRLGIVALGCAAADDATAWCLLAIVVGIVKAKVGAAVFVTAGAVTFIAVMFLVVRPLLERWCAHLDRQGGRLSQSSLVLGLVGALLAALVTESIGIHAIFGAFILGVLIPHDSLLGRELQLRLRDSVTIILLPAFFAYTGMRTQIGLISGPDNWLVCMAIIAVATLGKFGGTVAAARITGIGWHDAAALGALMNTRGLMELIVLNIGLDLGVISPTLFAMMVVMALATTMATSPVLSWLVPEFGDHDDTTPGAAVAVTVSRKTISP